MWCPCIFAKFLFIFCHQQNFFHLISIAVLQLCSITVPVPILCWIKFYLCMQICYLAISPGLRPLRFPGAEAWRLLNMFKNVQDLECQDKSLLCFLYAGFGSPNIHLTFKICCGTEQRNLWEVAAGLTQVTEATVRNSFPFYHIDCNGRCSKVSSGFFSLIWRLSCSYTEIKT